MQSNTQQKKNETIIWILAATLTAVFILVVTFVAVGQSETEMSRLEYLSYQEGRLDSYDKAWQEGLEQGRTEMEYRAEYEKLASQADSYNDGWQQGYNDSYRYDSY